MKYRIIQNLWRDEFESSEPEYKYQAQYRYNWLPIWFDISYEKNSKIEAIKVIDYHREARKMKTVIHNVDIKQETTNER